MPARPEILEALSGVRGPVLDLGCGDGVLARGLTGVEVVGVEGSAGAAFEARHVCSRVHVLDLDREDVPEPPGSFEALVYGDVLEHLRDPWSALARHRALLRPGGRLVASVPNAQHWRTSLGLLLGRWSYRDPDGQGHVLARDHLRFFTRRTLVAAAEGAGYRVMRVRPVASSLALALSPGPLRGLAAFRYVLTAVSA